MSGEAAVKTTVNQWAAVAVVFVASAHAQEIYLQGGTQGVGIGAAVSFNSLLGAHAVADRARDPGRGAGEGRAARVGFDAAPRRTSRTGADHPSVNGRSAVFFRRPGWITLDNSSSTRRADGGTWMASCRRCRRPTPATGFRPITTMIAMFAIHRRGAIIDSNLDGGTHGKSSGA